MRDHRRFEQGAIVDKRRTMVLLARIAASGVMLWVLLSRIPDFDAGSAVPDWTAGSMLWLAGAAGLTLAGIVLSTIRWMEVLAALGLRARLGRLLSFYLAGQFVANVLPTTIGGDVLRVSRLAKDTGEAPRTFASVVLERLTGWLVLPVITFVGFLVNPGLTHLGTATHVALALASGTLVGLLLVLVVVASRPLVQRSTAPTGWRRFAGAVHLGVDGLRRRPGVAARVLAVGFAYQLVVVLAAVMAAQALGLRVAGLTAMLAFFPAVAIAQVLPIGISGLGVRESAFVLFLTPLGVPAEQAVALGLLLYVLNLLVSLLGAPAFAIGSRPAPASASASSASAARALV